MTNAARGQRGRSSSFKAPRRVTPPLLIECIRCHGGSSDAAVCADLAPLADGHLDRRSLLRRRIIDDGARKVLRRQAHVPAVVRGGHGTKRACIRYRGDEWNRSQSGSSYQRPPGVKPGRPLSYAPVNLTPGNESKSRTSFASLVLAAGDTAHRGDPPHRLATGATALFFRPCAARP